MRTTKRVLVMISMWMFMVMAAWAQAAPTVRLAWDPVTTYEDGVPIEAGKVVKYDVWRATSSTLVGAVRVAFDLTATTHADATVVPKNTYYYYVRAYLFDTMPSANSNTASARVWPPFRTQIQSITIER